MEILEYYGIKHEPTENDTYSPTVGIAELPVMGVSYSIEDAIRNCGHALRCLLEDYKGMGKPYPITEIPDNLGVIYQFNPDNIQAKLSPTRTRQLSSETQ